MLPTLDNDVNEMSHYLDLTVYCLIFGMAWEWEGSSGLLRARLLELQKQFFPIIWLPIT